MKRFLNRVCGMPVTLKRDDSGGIVKLCGNLALIFY